MEEEEEEDFASGWNAKLVLGADPEDLLAAFYDE
jgi:hypothetical protein